ncbi:MAG: hypothetical protein WAW79_12935 [Steroidobacteraceae bacterium]
MGYDPAEPSGGYRMFEYLVVIALLSGQEASRTVDCRLIEDNAERLACYDSTAGRPPGSAPIPGKAENPQEAAPAVEDFGLTDEQRDRKKQNPPATIDMVETRVAAVERQPWDDRFTLTLDNGQKWAQLEPTPIQRFRVGDAITIRKAAFNSYLARGPNSGTGVRVRRLD